MLFTSLYPSAGFPYLGVFSRSTARALVDAGLDVVVVAPTSLTPPRHSLRSATAFRQWSRRAFARDVAIEDVPRIDVRWIAPPGQIVGFHAARVFHFERRGRLGRVFAELRPDVILSKWLPDGVAACLIGERFGVPVVAGAIGGDIHTLPETKVGWVWARDTLNARAAAITYVSHALAREGAIRGLVAPACVIPDGVDSTIFTCGPHRARRLRVLSVGNLYPVKGHDVLVDAFARLVRQIPEAELHIVGAGTEHDALVAQVRRCGLTDRVVFRGQMPHAALADEYRAAAVFAMPSRREGLPNVVLEAIASGTPVVASDVGGLSEIVTHCNGILVPPNDPELLAHALRTALQRSWDPGVVRETVVARYSWAGVGASYRDLFESVTGRET